jgi:hypothetical protein
VAGSCEHGNEPLGFVNVGKFFEHLSNCCVLKDDFASSS